MPETDAVVDALRSLVVFGPDQAGAYRELASAVTATLGADVPTRLNGWLEEWALSNEPGLVILTGNAGTGKTAATQHFCAARGGQLPATDALSDVAGALVAKDASGLASRPDRAELLRRAMAERTQRQVLLCVNEGVLRDAATDLQDEEPELLEWLEIVLRHGAHRDSLVTIVNVNRQRLTSDAIWEQLIDYVAREELWHGCSTCPAVGTGDGCPMRANAAALRTTDVRDTLRQVLRICSGEMTPTMREVLALLAYSICGGVDRTEHTSLTWTCDRVATRHRDRGRQAFTTESAYFNLLLGTGISAETQERSPLLDAIRRLGCGPSADLEVDGWIRDANRAPGVVRSLAGVRALDSDQPLAGSLSHLDRARTESGERTFAEIGETVAISENATEVQVHTKALVAGETPVIHSWRRRILFEAPGAIGGGGPALGRLSALPFAYELVSLSRKVARQGDPINELAELVRGLNFLVTGHSDASEGLVVPDPSSLFARNPGAFRPALPAFVNAKVPLSKLRLRVPDVGLVEELLDIDYVEVVLHLVDDPAVGITIGPRLYQAVREAGLYRGPVGQGTAEMTQVRAFYSQLATSEAVAHEQGMLVTDPERGVIARVQLPQFVA